MDSKLKALTENLFLLLGKDESPKFSTYGSLAKLLRVKDLTLPSLLEVQARLLDETSLPLHAALRNRWYQVKYTIDQDIFHNILCVGMLHELYITITTSYSNYSVTISIIISIV